jgi:hypothetical protein
MENFDLPPSILLGFLGATLLLVFLACAVGTPVAIFRDLARRSAQSWHGVDAKPLGAGAYRTSVVRVGIVMRRPVVVSVASLMSLYIVAAAVLMCPYFFVVSVLEIASHHVGPWTVFSVYAVVFLVAIAALGGCLVRRSRLIARAARVVACWETLSFGVVAFVLVRNESPLLAAVFAGLASTHTLCLLAAARAHDRVSNRVEPRDIVASCA